MEKDSESAERLAFEQRLGAYGLGMLNTLSKRLVLTDTAGKTLWVNDAWEKFAAQPRLPTPLKVGVGDNFLEACLRAEGHRAFAHEALQGIYNVIDRVSDSFSFEYGLFRNGTETCHRMIVRALSPPLNGLLISHVEVTPLYQMRVERDHLELELRQALTSLSALGSLLPVCPDCGRLRDDDETIAMLRGLMLRHAETLDVTPCPACQAWNLATLRREEAAQPEAQKQ